MEPKAVKADIGVIIGRFQIDDLHAAHHDLIKTVMARHKRVLILIGNTPTKVTRSNPLDFMTRKLMIAQSYPDIPILPVRDTSSDSEWSKGVDLQVRSVYDMGSVALYGSRDGFIPFYNGEFQTIELESKYPELSSTEIREMAAQEVKASSNFRKGVIYASYNKYPIAFHTVDVAILSEDNSKVLLARKNSDQAGKWRFVGGFVDPVKDRTVEAAAVRELREEAGGAEYEKPVYVGSAKINDWRYRNEPDGIITSFFAARHLWGRPRAADDIDDLKWFDLESLFRSDGYQVVDEHKVLVSLLKNHLTSKRR